MPDKILIASSEFGAGKSVLGLSYGSYVPGNTLSIDLEDGQRYYMTEDETDIKSLKFNVTRVVMPSLYDIQFLVRRIARPTTPSTDFRIDDRPVDANKLSPEVKKIASAITKGELVVGTVILDSVTQLCEHVQNYVSKYLIEKYTNPRVEDKNKATEDAIAKLERSAQLVYWPTVKDTVGEIIDQLLFAQVNVILIAWGKPKYDKELRQSTDEFISDLLKNIRAYVDLEIMLYPNAPSGKVYNAPNAKVLKSRIPGLLTGSIIKNANWDTIMGYKLTEKVVEEAKVDN